MALGLGCTFSAAQAADAGDPVFPVDMERKARAELMYENRRRDLDNGETFKADAYTLRIHTDVGQYAYLDFDVGGISPQGGDLEFYGGIGLRYLAYDAETFRISPFAQVHYAPGLKTRTARDFDLVEFDAGILVAGKWRLDDQLTLIPYIGPMVSILRFSSDLDAREDNPVGGVAGLSLLMPGQNTFRFEMQVFDGVSFSVAAGIAF
ncbi:MAG TPA: hypothetical protein PKA21_08340 [Kiritimatiellia bacterium]|nr:hypothetical protein [Kiritimatiellia bacterium]